MYINSYEFRSYRTRMILIMYDQQRRKTKILIDIYWLTSVVSLLCESRSLNQYRIM